MKRLPSERELCASLDVHRETVRRAIASLRLEGRIDSRIGSGHYNTRPKLEKELTDLLSFTRWACSMGMEPGSRILRQECLEASRSVCGFLQVPLGTRLFHAVRLRMLDGASLLLEYVYLSEEAYPGLSDCDLSSGSLYAILSERYGAELYRGHETISITYLDAWEARHLEVSAGSPAFFVRSVVTDKRDKPVEYCKTVMRWDRVRLVCRREEP